MNPLTWTYAIRDIPADGLNIQRSASDAELQGLAAALEVMSVEAMSLECRLVPRSGGRVALTGTVNARLVQECVVTLQPVPAVLRLPLDVIFTPMSAKDATPIEASLQDLDAPDEEPIENGTMDVGHVVLEELVSGLDPYPRAPDASFEWQDDQAAANDNPFAVLSRIKKPRDSD